MLADNRDLPNSHGAAVGRYLLLSAVLIASIFVASPARADILDQSGNVIPGTEGRRLVGWAQRAEDLGFDSLGVIDRVVYDSYEALLALAMAAAVTERIGLVTNVVIAPLRNTGMLAKQAASLDRASGGRLTLGLALGARDDDFVACGLPTRERGRTLDAQLGELG